MYFIIIFIKETLAYPHVGRCVLGSKTCHFSRFQLATKIISGKLLILLVVSSGHVNI